MDFKNGVDVKKIPIRNAQIGGIYFTPRGMKIKVLRQRLDGDDFVVRSITSGGHEIVLPGGLMVTGEELPIDLVQEEAEPQPIENTLPNLIFHIVKESQVTVDDIVDVTGYSKEDVEAELQTLLQPTVN